jgi:hypothetical protein
MTFLELVQFNSVRVFIASTAVAGSEVFATVYSIDPSTGDFIFETSSNPVTNHSS